MALKAFPPLVFRMTVRGTQEMNYRIEKKDAICVVGKKISLRPTLEENFKITPRFWAECAEDGTIARLAPDPDNTRYEIWLPIVRKREEENY